jgi:protein ImuB
LVPEAVVLQRDLFREEEARLALTLAMFQFTPNIALDGADGLIAEVGKSLRLFGGPHALCRRVRDCARKLGFTVQIGLAPTGAGASMLARRIGGRSQRCAGAACRKRALSGRFDGATCCRAALLFPPWFEEIE